MATIRIRYLTSRKRRDGTLRWFWQPSAHLREKGWLLTRLPDDFEAARVEAMRLNAALDAWYGGNGQPVHGTPGSVDSLIGAYKASRDYREKADKTRRGYDENLMIIARLIGDKPARLIRPQHARKIVEALSARTPARARAVVAVGRLLWNFGAQLDLVESNPWKGQTVRHRPQKGRLWQPEDIASFVAKADDMGLFSIGTAILLNEWIGQRRGDLIAMTRAMYSEGQISFRQSKTGAEVFLPVDIVPRVKARLDEQMARNAHRGARQKVTATAIIQTPDGGPYTPARFRTDFESVRSAAAAEHPAMAGLVFKDLRHTAVTRLAEAGCEITEIAAITGHCLNSCAQIIDRYNVRTKQAAMNAMKKRLTAEGKSDM